MSNQPGIHPLAPEVETPHEQRENRTEAVKVRSGIEIGAMRWVLGIGIVLAILAFVIAYFGGYLPHR